MSDSTILFLIEGIPSPYGPDYLGHGMGMDRVIVRDGFRLNYNAAKLQAERNAAK